MSYLYRMRTTAKLFLKKDIRQERSLFEYQIFLLQHIQVHPREDSKTQHLLSDWMPASWNHHIWNLSGLPLRKPWHYCELVGSSQGQCQLQLLKRSILNISQVKKKIHETVSFHILPRKIVTSLAVANIYIYCLGLLPTSVLFSQTKKPKNFQGWSDIFFYNWNRATSGLQLPQFPN